MPFSGGFAGPKGAQVGENKLDTSFLKSFLEVCLQMDCAKLKTLERTCVMTEYLIDNGRRIDIMLQHPQFSIPIEVKINAGDQESQCYDYHFYVRNTKVDNAAMEMVKKKFPDGINGGGKFTRQLTPVCQTRRWRCRC